MARPERQAGPVHLAAGGAEESGQMQPKRCGRLWLNDLILTKGSATVLSPRSRHESYDFAMDRGSLSTQVSTDTERVSIY